MGTITSASAVFLLAIQDFAAAPQIMQGYDVDDAFMADAVEVGQAKIGVDGILSAGLVYETTKFNFVLQADSPSISLMEAWYQAELSAVEKFFATGVLRMPSIRRTYQLVDGVMTRYTPFAGAKRVLQPRPFTLEFQRIVGAPL